MSTDDSLGEMGHKQTSDSAPVFASALIFLGCWGLLLAVLNMFGNAHPTYHISWGGLFTFETWNAAFGTGKDGFHYEPLGDTIFLAICLGMIGYGGREINNSKGINAWIIGLVKNDTWPALADPYLGGGQRTMAAWCLLLGLIFYIWWGINHTGWFDVGVYSVFIALMSAGFALDHASRAPPGDDKIE